mgnify:CR=1 FL=1
MRIFLFIGKTNKQTKNKERANIVSILYSHAGVSRSATLVLAYLMTIGDYDVEKALQIVKGARGYIQPNPGFLSQLRKYHASDVKRVNHFQKNERYKFRMFFLLLRIGIV